MHRWQGSANMSTPSFCPHFLMSRPWPHTLGAGDFLFYRLAKKKEEEKLPATTVSTTPAKFSAGFLGIQDKF